MHKLLIAFGTFAALALGSSATGFADPSSSNVTVGGGGNQRAGFPRAVERACGSDARRLCPGQTPGTPGMRYCMEAKQRSFTRNCQQALEDSGIAPRGYFARRRG